MSRLGYDRPSSRVRRLLVSFHGQSGVYADGAVNAPQPYLARVAMIKEAAQFNASTLR